MKTSKTRNPQHTLYLYRIVTLIVLILFTAAGGGLGLLWLRQETSASAARIRASEHKLAEAKRRLQYYNVKIAEATTPQNLRRRVDELHLGLVPPRQQQLVRLGPNPMRNDQPKTMVASDTPQEPLFVTFELALIKNGTSAN